MDALCGLKQNSNNIFRQNMRQQRCFSCSDCLPQPNAGSSDWLFHVFRSPTQNTQVIEVLAIIPSPMWSTLTELLSAKSLCLHFLLVCLWFFKNNWRHLQYILSFIYPFIFIFKLVYQSLPEPSFTCKSLCLWILNRVFLWHYVVGWVIWRTHYELEIHM